MTRWSWWPRLALAAYVAGTLASARARAESPDDEPSPPAFDAPVRAQPAPAAPAPLAQASAFAAPPAANTFLPSLAGPIGLYDMSTAEVGPLHHLRFALHGRYFTWSDFLVDGDEDSRFDGSFSFGFTPHRNVELFGAILSASNRNDRPPEVGRTDPPVIKTFGDLIVGAKGVLPPLAPGLTVGAELGFRFLSSVSGLAVSPSSTSLWFGPLATFDLRPVFQIPVRVHANLSFYLDNSGNLFDFTGTTLTTREVAEFAYGIEDSRIRFALGADVPLERLTAPIPLQPFIEYHVEVVTAGADPAFAAFANKANRDQQWLTLGLRARAYRDFTVDAGVEVALTSVGYAYGPPLPPYQIVFGIGWPIDLDAMTRPVAAARAADAQPAPPAAGTVVGSVKSARDGKPIGGAVLAFASRPRARVATDDDGGFTSGPLAPGPVGVEVTAAGFGPGKAQAVVIAGRAASIEVALAPMLANGSVHGKVRDTVGGPLDAVLRFTGAAPAEARTDGSGAFSASLRPGPYRVVVEAPGMPSKELALDVEPGRDQELNITLHAAHPDVTLDGPSVRLATPIKFRPGWPRLSSEMTAELDGVADLMLDHPDLKTLRIEAYWNGPTASGGQTRGRAADADVAAHKLTERQARLIEEYLVSKGVPADRLQPVGRGGESPLVPGVGPDSLKKNRRVELLVLP